MTVASINKSSERGWGSTLFWHKGTILNRFYVHTCRPSLSGVHIVGFAFHVATQWVLPCCIPVVVGAWLAACVRVVFGVNQVPMGVAVTATVFLLPTSTFVAVVHRFVVVHRFYKVFDLSIFCFDLVAEFFHRVG